MEVRVEVTTTADQVVTVNFNRNELHTLGLAVDTEVHLRVTPHAFGSTLARQPLTAQTSLTPSH